MFLKILSVCIVQHRNVLPSSFLPMGRYVISSKFFGATSFLNLAINLWNIVSDVGGNTGLPIYAWPTGLITLPLTVLLIKWYSWNNWFSLFGRYVIIDSSSFQPRTSIFPEKDIYKNIRTTKCIWLIDDANRSK